jgi:hypothetical protein
MTEWDISKLLEVKEISPQVVSVIAQHAYCADQLRATLRIYHGIELTKQEAEAIYDSYKAKLNEE